jgi:hypothetical protein
MKMAHKSLVRSFKKRHNFTDLGVDGRIILNRILQKQAVMWAAFDWLWTWSSGVLLRTLKHLRGK